MAEIFVENPYLITVVKILILIALVFPMQYALSLADRKGFYANYWILPGGGLIGLLIIQLLPSASMPGLATSQALKRMKLADFIGIFLSLLTIPLLGYIFGTGFDNWILYLLSPK